MIYISSDSDIKDITEKINNHHTCDEFESCIREISFHFREVFEKMYRLYRKILGSFQGGFENFLKKWGILDKF